MTDDSETELTFNSNIYVDPKVLKITKEMLILRGYTIYKEIDPKDTYKQLLGVKDDKYISCLFTTEYNKDSKLNVARMNDYTNVIVKSSIKHFIIIHNENDVSSRVANIINNIIIANNNEIKVETFCKDSLKYNLTKNKYVPKIEVLSKIEADIIRKKYKHCLQYFSIKDPQIKFYGINKGEIVKVFRNDGIIIYKIVI